MMVAPHAGAWIETETLLDDADAAEAVAPHAGAWIETGKWIVQAADVNKTFSK